MSPEDEAKFLGEHKAGSSTLGTRQPRSGRSTLGVKSRP